jgi:hypothetical protein
MKRQLSAVILMVFVSFVTSRTGVAQNSFGRLSGQVTDASGGTVSDAMVTIENLGNHTNRVVHTNTAGEYVAPDLEPGRYSITVEATGFGKLERRGISACPGLPLAPRGRRLEFSR